MVCNFYFCICCLSMNSSLMYISSAVHLEKYVSQVLNALPDLLRKLPHHSQLLHHQLLHRLSKQRSHRQNPLIHRYPPRNHQQPSPRLIFPMNSIVVLTIQRLEKRVTRQFLVLVVIQLYAKMVKHVTQELNVLLRRLYHLHLALLSQARHYLQCRALKIRRLEHQVQVDLVAVVLQLLHLCGQKVLVDKRRQPSFVL